MITNLLTKHISEKTRLKWQEWILVNRSRFVLAISLSLISLVSISSVMLNLGASKLERFDYFTVQLKDVSETVLGRGVVVPTEVATVVSELPRDRATIIWMANEGDMVEQGDLIARFDPQVTQNKLDETNNELVSAKVKLLNANKALELRQKEQKAEMESAKNSKEITLLSARDVKYGSGALQKEKLKQKIVQHERKLVLITLETADFKAIFEKGHISQRELDRSLNQKREAEEELAFSKDEYSNFETYVWPKLLRESELLAEKADKDFIRAVEKSALELERLKEEVTVTQNNVERFMSQVSALTFQLQLCQVRAPITGMLLYKKTRRVDGVRNYKIGDKVWKGQTLFEIPNTNDLMISARIRELDISKIKIGQKTTVRIDALSGSASNNTVEGSVTHIRHYADDSDGTPDQLFSVNVKINTSENLLVGMSALVSITTASLNDALSVSNDAIFYDGGQAYVNVLVDDDVNKKAVELGLFGRQWVQVISGVSLGETVLVERF